MKHRSLLLIVLALVVCIILIATAGSAAVSKASILYQEQDVGEGFWQYDYTFRNNTATEYLYSVSLNFGGTYAVNSPSLSPEWTGSWGIISPTSFVEAHTYTQENEVSPTSSLQGFSFKTDTQLGSISYTAYFDDHAGNITSDTGLTSIPVVPEPISSTLFLIGGATLGFRRFKKNFKK